MTENQMQKGVSFKIDRWNIGEYLEYKVDRVCRRHINVSNDDESWAMPYDRVMDCRLVQYLTPN